MKIGMTFQLQFDRPIDKEKHIISPGGYEAVTSQGSLCFYFLVFEGNVNPRRPDCLYTRNTADY